MTHSTSLFLTLCMDNLAVVWLSQMNGGNSDLPSSFVSNYTIRTIVKEREVSTNIAGVSLLQQHVISTC